MSSSAEVIQPTSEQTPVAPGSAWGGAGLVDTVAPSPWSAPPKEQASFRELMSEDLAQEMQDQENEDYYKALIGGTSDPNTLLESGRAEDTSEDFILAQMLQYEFDREYDQHVNREEKHVNKNCKVSVSLSKYKLCPTWYGPDSDDELHDLDEDGRDLDSFEARERDDPVIPPCGFVKHGKKIVTKHDLAITGRKNAERIMNLPPGINTGDGGGFDMHLPNSVYNKLQRAAFKELKSKNRVHDKVDKATSEMALDPNTRLLIFKLVNNAVLDSVNGVISSGKEAVVFHAVGGETEERPLPEECAVKVFKTTLTDFKTRERYIKEDYRFKDRMSKKNTQKSIRMWAEKEYHNLRRLQKAAIPSPEPVLIRQHILIMSFIGANHHAAPKLKDAILSFADLCIAYEQIVELMVKMFRGCHLVHADLSEYNVLWHNGLCWIIDVGQAVEPTHPHALHFLHRDCTNVIRFFKSKGVPELPTPLQLFEKVSGISLPGTEEEAYRMINEYENHQELWRESMKSTSNSKFEFLWQEIQAEEQQRKKAQKEVMVDEQEDSSLEEDELLEEFVVVDESGEELDTNKCSSVRKKSSSEGSADDVRELDNRLHGCSLDGGASPEDSQRGGKAVKCRVSFLDEEGFPSLAPAQASPSGRSVKNACKNGKKKKNRKHK